MIVDHAAAAARTDAREKAHVEQVQREQLGEAILKRLEALEEAQEFTANRLGELVVHEHLEVENRLTAVEAVQEEHGRQALLAKLEVIENLARGVMAAVEVLTKRLEAAEAKLQRLDFFATNLNVNLEEATARVIALEKQVRR